MGVKIVSSDLNGTLVHQHTMSDMIKVYLGEEKFKKADVVFKKQTSGTATMEEAFENAGPLTRGLTLRQALEYTEYEMNYVNGFSHFIDLLQARNIPFIINSTGYDVTIFAIRALVGKNKIHGSIGNTLEFAEEGSIGAVVKLEELEEMVDDFFTKDRTKPIYDSIKATGRVHLGILNEGAKAKLLLEYVQRNFPSVQSEGLMHMGDTIGDVGGIVGVAQAGGIGIAFNYNQALKDRLDDELQKDPEKKIYFVDKKGLNSDLRNVFAFLS